MADEIKDQNEAEVEEPTVKVAEMKRRLEQEQKKAQDQLDAMQASIDQRIADEVAKAQEAAKLTGKELEEYKQKEMTKKYEDEIARRDQELEQLRQENLQRTIRDEAHTKLAEMKLTNSPETISLVMGQTLEEMSERVEQLAKYTTQIKNQFASSEPPLGSGGLGAQVHTPGDIFRDANILNKQEER